MVVAPEPLDAKHFEACLGRGVVGTPLGTLLEQGNLYERMAWSFPWKLSMAPGVDRNPLLPHVVAHLWQEKGSKRENVHGLSGPGRWPLVCPETSHYEPLVVFDRGGPLGSVRPLSPEEVWQLQGRTTEEWSDLVKLCGNTQIAYDEGCRATGVRTAETLLTALAITAVGGGGDARLAGAIRDGPLDESLARLLIWLRKWKRGDFGPDGLEGKAGGGNRLVVCRYGESLWLEALEDEVNFNDWKAGGRRRRGAEEAKAEGRLVIPDVVNPFDGDVVGRVEDWLEANLTGDKAESTACAYAGMWAKWCAWARRKQWETEYLCPKEDKIDKENKLLAFLGYLGWLNFSSASLKQAVFAIKDAHKRAGAGDPTEGLHRLWVLMNALDRRAARKPRRLGVTPSMLLWLGQQLQSTPGTFGEVKVDVTMLQAALLTAWFFMMRASEFCDSNGVNLDGVLRGIDVKLTKEESRRSVAAQMRPRCSSERPRRTRKPLDRAKLWERLARSFFARLKLWRNTEHCALDGFTVLKQLGLCFDGEMEPC